MNTPTNENWRLGFTLQDITHLCVVKPSTSSLWTDPIPIEGDLDSVY